MATLPFLLLLLDYWPLNRFGRPASKSAPINRSQRLGYKRIILEKIPFVGVIVMAGMGLLFSWDKNEMRVLDGVLAGHGVLVAHVGVSMVIHTAQAFLTPFIYLKQMFYPVGLVVFSPLDPNVPIWQIMVTSFLWIIIPLVAFVQWRQRPWLLVGWLWYLIMLAPVLVLIQRGFEIRCDRYTYLSQIGVYLLLTWTVVDFFDDWRSRTLVLSTGAAAILTGLLITAHKQTSYWRDSVSLWSHTIVCTSGNYMAYYNLGDTFRRQGKLDDAIEQYEQSLRINPDHADVLNNLGATFAKQGKLKESIPPFERALRLKPEFADAHYNLGNVLDTQGKLEEAIPHYEQAIRFKSDHVEAHYNLGLALAKQGKLDDAIQHWKRVLQLKPDYVGAHYNLGLAFVKQEKLDQALQHWDQALRLKPDYAEAHNNMGVALVTQGNLPDALRHFQQALKLATVQNNTVLAQSIRAQIESLPPTSP